jgi:hypothetical protein
MLGSLAISLVLLASASPDQADRWVPERANPSLWKEVRAALREELEPDDPVKVRPYVALIYKYVAQIAKADGVCLVLIGAQETKSEPEVFTVAFSYDTRSGKKTRTGIGFSALRVVATAFLGGTTYPDIFVRSQSCTECEATYLLSSFFIEPASRTWKLRRWPGNMPDALIGHDMTIGNFRDDSELTCLFRVGDFSGAGHADVAVWCHEEFASHRKRPDSVRLYTLSGTGALTIVPTELVKRETLKQALCRAEPSPLFCRSRH